ncbi:hypothetical protein F2Q69_00059803 [Brassica cretica]|uniref:Uncharacterized protein n=1 Tax=Brassica cretica TaxID=69181 RepID=A0A8S9RE76_BRACR|nr:hypothetical protein F2Q69_00059803 [Brassica cretica]
MSVIGGTAAEGTCLEFLPRLEVGWSAAGKTLAVEFLSILAAVSSTVPSISVCSTRFCRVALSTGSSTFMYCRVDSLSSSITDSKVGRPGGCGRTSIPKLVSSPARGEWFSRCRDVASWPGMVGLARPWGLGDRCVVTLLRFSSA